MNKIKEIEKKILISFKRMFKNKSKRLHDPLFVGNEKKYLNNCISSGYVSYVANMLKFLKKKYHHILKANIL